MLNQRHINSKEEIFHRYRLFGGIETEQSHILQIQENRTVTFEGALSWQISLCCWIWWKNNQFSTASW